LAKNSIINPARAREWETGSKTCQTDETVSVSEVQAEETLVDPSYENAYFHVLNA